MHTPVSRRGAAWEDAFLNAVGQAEENHMFRYISTARFASRTLDNELERNTRTVVPYFSTTFLIMAAFSMTSCWMTDWVRAKPWLGLLGNISACMGTAAAFGVTMYLGVEFIGINLAAPFLMLGKWIPSIEWIISIYMEQSPSSGGDQDIPRLVHNPMIHHHVHKRPS
jgi:hypothetical protein